jgi:TPR repeat protein
MINLFIIVLLCYLLLLEVVSFRVNELEIRLGDSEGISPSSTISQEQLQRILAGVENGNKENIYYYGLLKLYGISVSKDLSMAAQHFLRASSLDHKEATTAYGVMLMSGHGMKKDLAQAIRFFRKAVSLGDMVSSSDLQ